MASVFGYRSAAAGTFPSLPWTNLNYSRCDLTPLPSQQAGMGAAHLLKEIVVVRFDGGAHQPQNKDTTMLNTTDKIIKHKTGLLNLAEELGNVSKSCQVMGMSRDTFYRYKGTVTLTG